MSCEGLTFLEIYDMDKRKIYLSLPITGYPLAERRQTAARMSGTLMSQHEHWDVVNPFHIFDKKKKELLDMGVFDDPSYEDIMQADLEALRKCDAAFFMKGWTESAGCRREMNLCIDKNIEVMFENA